MTEQDRNVTAAYRRNGALLSVSAQDAIWLIATGRGEIDWFGGEGPAIPVSIPPQRIDRVICGENPALFLTGGVEIRRGDVDEVVAVRPIDISGLFDD
jgi:hypothetical protein